MTDQQLLDLFEKKLKQFPHYHSEKAMIAAMREACEQSTKKLSDSIKAFMSTIPLDNGNWYLPGFDEALENLKNIL